MNRHSQAQILRFPCPIGERFGSFTVISDVPHVPRAKRKWIVLCDCGVTKEVAASSLRSGGTKSCGCLKHENPYNRTHNRSRTPAYGVWAAMRRRCNNSNSLYFYRYGGRGIKVCERWSSFSNFLADMGECPTGMTLDRIDNNGNYEPGNCRWATRKEQSRNTSTNRFETAFGETKTMAEWAADPRCAVNVSTIYRRLARGWDFERSIATVARYLADVDAVEGDPCFWTAMGGCTRGERFDFDHG